MADQAFYPAVAFGYFAVLSWESRGHRLLLGTAASVNVFCLFIFAQPVCMAIGGYLGVGIYLFAAFISYLNLPRGERQRPEKREQGHGNEAGIEKDSEAVGTEERSAKKPESQKTASGERKREGRKKNRKSADKKED